ncbi:uracil-DNA glycosylase [Pseudoroseomonas rhizosphaerae]|uniref:Type-4 uracil-DNA glycosylase n=1 Tax=Teichococcus rhizosphaerae TaxID=1335062 RepID=A0A2C7A8J7_9PROT|nr:UdgX family uracil-DNA binding protein [Pseudoroseomonas rhizosphaerae]PHK93366.1 uracil-DNA glycosylase [Pseudoroseomonas rhizosphaerae]
MTPPDSNAPAPSMPVPVAGWAEGRPAILGEGPRGAPLMFVGEQPGDEEDRQGHPFVGPAGRLFDRALEAAGIDRKASYVTNAVKHFKYIQRGARRLHQSPDAGDIRLYRPFLVQEVATVSPRFVVALGATATQALMGRKLPLLKLRGQVFEAPEELPAGLPVLITVHPSYLLRLPDPELKRREFERFVAELQFAGRAARGEIRPREAPPAQAEDQGSLPL